MHTEATTRACHAQTIKQETKVPTQCAQHIILKQTQYMQHDHYSMEGYLLLHHSLTDWTRPPGPRRADGKGQWVTDDA